MNLNNMRRFGVEVEFVSNLDRREVAVAVEYETGIKLELASYSDKSNKWRLKTDNSIASRGGYGMELVTPILFGEEQMTNLRDVLKVIEGIGTVNRTCGLHVHIDITDEGAEPLRRLQKFFAKYEHAIGTLLPESRRGGNNGYCRDHFYRDQSLIEVFKKLNKRKNTNDLTGSREFGHRGKWNFQNYWRHGSVENRAHSGTTNPIKVDHWVRLTQAMIAAAFDFRGATIREGDTCGTYTAKNMLDELRGKGLIELSTKKFYMRRYKELNDAVCR